MEYKKEVNLSKFARKFLKLNNKKTYIVILFAILILFALFYIEHTKRGIEITLRPFVYLNEKGYCIKEGRILPKDELYKRAVKDFFVKQYRSSRAKWYWVHGGDEPQRIYNKRCKSKDECIFYGIDKELNYNEISTLFIENKEIEHILKNRNKLNTLTEEQWYSIDIENNLKKKAKVIDIFSEENLLDENGNLRWTLFYHDKYDWNIYFTDFKLVSEEDLNNNIFNEKFYGKPWLDINHKLGYSKYFLRFHYFDIDGSFFEYSDYDEKFSKNAVYRPITNCGEIEIEDISSFIYKDNYSYNFMAH